MASQQSSQQSSSTFFSDPAMVQRMLDALGGQMNQFDQYLSDPTSSPLYTNQLRGLMASLAPQEAQSRQAYTDAGVAAGNRSSGRFAQGQANLEGNIMRNQQTTAGQLLGQNFGQMTQALLAAMGLTPQMLNALKLQQSSGSSQGSNDAGGGSGGGGGGGGYGGGGGGGFLSAPNLGYQPGVGLPQSYGNSPGIIGPNYNPAEHAAWGNDINNWSNSFGGVGTGLNFGQENHPVDSFGFTEQDWANDPYFN